jgi:hypothetical protein
MRHMQASQGTFASFIRLPTIRACSDPTRPYMYRMWGNTDTLAA